MYTRPKTRFGAAVQRACTLLLILSQLILLPPPVFAIPLAQDPPPEQTAATPPDSTPVDTPPGNPIPSEEAPMPDNLGDVFEGIASDEVTLEPAPESNPALPTAPGILTVDSSHYLLQVGEQITLTVRIDDSTIGDTEETLEGLTLQAD